jgi:hypothetical protein
MSERITFERRLRRFSRARRGLLNGVLGFRLGLLALIAGIVGLILLSGWIPNVLVNLALFAILAVCLIILAVIGMVRRERFRGCLDEAFRLEALAGNLNSRVVSAWDFLHEEPLTPLQRTVVHRAADDLKEEYEARLNSQDRNLHGSIFAAAAVVFLAIGLTPWFGFGQVIDNLGRSWRGLQDMLFPIELTVEVSPRKPAYKLGSKVDVTLHVNRPSTGEAQLVQTIGEEKKVIPLTLDENHTARFTATSDIEAEQVLTFELGDKKSEDVTLIFTSPPVLVNMQTELVYPPYTRQPPRSLENIQQRLLALPGTRITLGFTFSKELQSATIQWDNKTELPLEVVGRYATVSLVQSEDVKLRQATLQVIDKHGFSLDEPLEIAFERQEDEPPQVMLPRHLKDDMGMLEPAAKLFGFGVQASDDYGVTKVVLRWRRSLFDDRSRVIEKGEVERLISPPQPRAVVNFEKVFADMGLKPGDRISFDVEVTDNRVPKPQKVVSRTCSFYIFQKDLGDLTVRELGFGGADPLARERIARSTRATTVKEPEGLKSREAVKNEFEGSITSGTQAPSVRGEHAQATRDYFRLLSTVKYPEAEPKKP